MSSRRIIPPSLWQSLGFQQLPAFSEDSTAQHSEDRAALLSPTFCLLSSPVSGASTVRKVAMPRQTVPSKPTRCCCLENQTVFALFRRAQKGDSDSYGKKGTTYSPLLRQLSFSTLTRPLMLFSKTNCCIFHI